MFEFFLSVKKSLAFLLHDAKKQLIGGCILGALLGVLVFFLLPKTFQTNISLEIEQQSFDGSYSTDEISEDLKALVASEEYQTMLRKSSEEQTADEDHAKTALESCAPLTSTTVIKKSGLTFGFLITSKNKACIYLYEKIAKNTLGLAFRTVYSEIKNSRLKKLLQSRDIHALSLAKLFGNTNTEGRQTDIQKLHARYVSMRKSLDSKPRSSKAQDQNKTETRLPAQTVSYESALAPLISDLKAQLSRITTDLNEAHLNSKISNSKFIEIGKEVRSIYSGLQRVIIEETVKYQNQLDLQRKLEHSEMLVLAHQNAPQVEYTITAPLRTNIAEVSQTPSKSKATIFGAAGAMAGLFFAFLFSALRYRDL